MKKRLLSILMALALCLSLLPVTALAADPAEQFPGLTPGETYWFDLSGANIPGNKNGSVPDDSLHWVPFTYVGTVNAYVLKSRSANDNTARGDSANAAGSTDPSNPIGYTYDHSLFIADYNVTSSANWNNLNGRNLIFGTAYTSGGVDYTLRAPSAGSGSTGSMDSERGTPLNNEWDAILDKANQSYQDNTVGYIKNWNGMYSWGQDTHDGPDPDWNRATRGSFTVRSWQFDLQLSPSVGFRPVLELPSSDTLGSDGLATVTLDLNGGKLGGSTDNIQIIVKNGAAFTAPASDGLTRPDGDTGDYFKWLGSDGNLYAPGDSVPADVTTLTAQWTPDTYTVTLHLNDGTIANGKNVTEYTYGTGATLPTADDITRAGHTFEGWYDDENFSGFPVTEISATDTGKKEFYAKWKDVTCPTGEITVDKSKWNTFFNNITFGLFFRDTQTVTITATDNSGEDVTIEYLLSDKELTVDQLNSATFTAYTKAFSINPDNQYVIYAKLTDTSGNVAYINSEGIVLDATSPVISGIENGKTYCEAQTVTVTEDYVESVKVNGTAVTLDANNQFTLNPAEGTQTIVVTDKAGNVSTEITVTVNDGHTDNNKDHKCDFCNENVGVHEDTDKDHICDICASTLSEHTGGEATCIDEAVCEYCGKEYGEFAPNSHADLKHVPAKAVTKTAEGNIEYWYCSGCVKYYKDAAATKEIAKSDTVIAKLPDDSKSPQTGDNSHMALWLAVLLVSGGALIVTGIYSRKKKRSEN